MEQGKARLQAWDVLWLTRATTLIRRPGWLPLILFLTHTGDGLFWIPMGAICWFGGIFWGGEWQAVGTRILLMVLVSFATSGVLKRLIRRARPQGENLMLYSDLDLYSFPSGHALRVGGLIVVMAGVLSPPAWVGLCLWGFAVCLTRVMLGVHFPSDVLGGLVLGALAGEVLLTRL